MTHKIKLNVCYCEKMNGTSGNDRLRD